MLKHHLTSFFVKLWRLAEKNLLSVHSHFRVNVRCMRPEMREEADCLALASFFAHIFISFGFHYKTDRPMMLRGLLWIKCLPADDSPTEKRGIFSGLRRKRNFLIYESENGKHLPFWRDGKGKTWRNELFNIMIINTIIASWSSPFMSSTFYHLTDISPEFLFTASDRKDGWLPVLA